MFGTDFDTPDGTGVRDYIHVSDLAAAHVDALDLLIARPGESHTLNRRLWPRLLGAPGARRGRPGDQSDDRAQAGGAPRGDPDALVADNGAILAALPWRPKHDDLEEIVKDALAWERRLAERQG